MSRPLDGRAAIVTGAARGIGRAIALALADAGASLAIADRQASGRETAREIEDAGGRCIFVESDVSKAADIARLVESTLSHHGSIDILCPNAAIFRSSLVVDMSEAEWDEVIACDLKSVFLIVRAGLPTMMKQRRGRIIVTGSITGARVGQMRIAHYGAAKAGIVGFVRCAALEAAPYNVTINVVEPGNIMSEAMMDVPHLHQSFIDHIPLNRIGDPAEVAKVVAFLASDGASYITGQSLVIDGGQILPENLPLARLAPA